MKRLLSFCLCLFLFATVVYGQKTNKVVRFINEYEGFVNEVLDTPFEDFHGDTLNRVKKKQRSFMRRYRWYYDNRMSEEQLEYFNKLCGRYHKKMDRLRSRRRWAMVRGRMQGRFEGLFRKENTTEDTLMLDTVPLPVAR
jgi:hypothetical protein